MCYRPDLLKAAGLPSDRATLDQSWSTWQGFIDFGKQYVAKAHKPFLDSTGKHFQRSRHARHRGVRQRGRQAGRANSDGVKTAWALGTQAAQAKITAGLSQFSTPWNQAFANGAFAAISCPSWMSGYITSQAGQAVSGDWDVANIPGGASNWGGSWLGVPKAGKNQAAAEAFAEWLTAPAQQITMWTSQGHFPSSSTAAKDPAVAAATSDYFNKAPIGQIFGDSASELKMVSRSVLTTPRSRAPSTPRLATWRQRALPGGRLQRRVEECRPGNRGLIRNGPGELWLAAVRHRTPHVDRPGDTRGPPFPRVSPVPGECGPMTAGIQ